MTGTYGWTKGAVHELIARNLAKDEGLLADSESIVVTVGWQEAMFLVLRAFNAGTSRIPMVKAVDGRRRAIYLGSFAKSVMPGARIGYVVADQLVGDGSGTFWSFADELSQLKSMLTVNTSPTSQAVVGGRLLKHLARQHHLLWTPMHHLYGGTGGHYQLRQPVVRLTSAQIDLGLDRLASLVDEAVRQGGKRPA